MPATQSDYSQIKVNQEKAAALNKEAAGMNATAFTLPDTIMGAVREDRQARGVSKLATDVGNVMGQMVTDPNAIRGTQEQGLMDPFSVNALTSNARAQNLKTLGTISTQGAANQGTLDSVIQAGANRLRQQAATLLAQAEEAATNADIIQQEWERDMKEKEFNLKASEAGKGGKTPSEKEQEKAAEVLANYAELKTAFPTWTDEQIVNSLMQTSGLDAATIRNILNIPAPVEASTTGFSSGFNKGSGVQGSSPSILDKINSLFGKGSSW